MSVQTPYKVFNFSFLSKKTMLIAFTISGLTILLSLGSLATRGLNFGIDFTGGTLVEVHYQEAVDLVKVRSALDKGGYDDAVVQYFGTSHDVMIRFGLHSDKNSDTLSNEVIALLRSDNPSVEMRRVEFVGPQVGKELLVDSSLAVLYVLIGVLIYVAIRFEKRFATGAVLALLHDPILILGLFSITGMEFDLTVLASILAVMGYSLNDTIVIFDRIRDNLLKLRKGETVDVMNLSINETLVRTLMTSFTTLLTVLALFFLGGKMIHGFATSLIVGIVVGTYSSIYIASALTLKLGASKADLMPTVILKEGEQAVTNDRP